MPVNGIVSLRPFIKHIFYLYVNKYMLMIIFNAILSMLVNGLVSFRLFNNHIF